jgi:hypothetical protein
MERPARSPRRSPNPPVCEKCEIHVPVRRAVRELEDSDGGAVLRKKAIKRSVRKVGK